MIEKRRRFFNISASSPTQIRFYKMYLIVFGMILTLGIGLMFSFSRLIFSEKFLSTYPEVADRLSEPLTRLFWIGSAAVLLVCWGTLAVAIVQAYRFLGPLIPIERHLRKLNSGDYEEDLVMRRGNDLAEITEELNKLTQKLRAGGAGPTSAGPSL